ncbi:MULTISPECIES: alginate export family protein [Dyella]|uniref:Alginate export domain-containing protein n=2 Tax=Dyella TaxID=231454 RepID=A0A4R0YWN9_9GAMM|nr:MULTISPECIES: alginate export family protein [Dyella]TBR39443.1 hypothetical protein EYV96_04300 [Dyella terrae]TCI12971.1 hypothetical protein EZM97_06565 [Dyella soli]
MSKLSITGCGVLMALVAAPATAVETDYALKTDIAVVDQTPGDFGRQDKNHSVQAYLDATPWMRFQFNQHWSGFLRVRLFAPTGIVQTNANDNNNVGPTNQAFLGLKEAWVDYAGFRYPGESIRLGRQRVRQDDAMYIDQDVDSARWIFKTTLVQSELGVGREFGTYRTDDVGLPPDQKHRLYVFGTLGGEWKAYQRIGVRMMYVHDDYNVPQPGQVTNVGTKLSAGNLLWVGAFLHNHYYDGADAPPFAYNASINWLSGNQRTALVDPLTRAVTDVTDRRVSHAWAADVAVRYRLPVEKFPLQLGAAYVYSSGGHGNDLSSQYSQTGLQSNYSRFTGTDSLTQRFTDAYRADLGNLKVATAFASMNMGQWNTSFIYNHFDRVHGDAPVYAENISALPVNTTGSLGQGYDLVVTRFFGKKIAHTDLLSSDEPASSVRFRGSVFKPGSAYGPNARNEYRVSLELVLWM